MHAGISQRLLVRQYIPADPLQPLFALIQDGTNGAKVPDILQGVAACCTEKLGLLSTTHTVTWDAGVMDGEVTIEVADEVNYTGAWAPVGVVNFQSTSAGVAGPKQDYINVPGGYAAFRHRITRQVTGGTVTTKIAGSV